ncbi:MAG: carotenoid biosynthesis protein [Spirochaetaceae bacterium]|nr:MAG: carotenoid biosynthesis protein [Spirochaetaceae bacterium]
MPQIITRALAELPLASTIFLVLWLLSMIMVPVVKWIWGAGAERIGISVGVLFQVATVVALLSVALPYPVVIALAFLIPTLGWLSEFAGCRTGIPFGPYSYTDVLQPQLGRVPVIIPLAWLMMMPPAWAVAELLVGSARPLLFAATAGLAFTAWDLFLDPQMVHWDFWRWHRRGRYFGIPLINFVGWFLVSAAITALIYALLPIAGLPLHALLLMYAITWLLETIAQAVFWNLRGSAIAGFIAMGALVMAASTAL